MSISAIDIGTLVVSTPETCGGRPRIAGTRISIAQIAVWNKQGLSYMGAQKPGFFAKILRWNPQIM